MNENKLVMKKVGIEYMEQYNALLRYVFQVTDEELSSVGWKEKEIIRAKFPTMEKANVIGWFDGDNLVSQVAVYPMKSMIFGQNLLQHQRLPVTAEQTSVGLRTKGKSREQRNTADI